MQSTTAQVKADGRSSRAHAFSQFAGYALALACMLPAAATAAIGFVESTAPSGVAYVGASWGAAWGDFNGDGRPDLWLPNHQNAPALYLNNGDGTFTDVTTDIVAGVASVSTYDQHGAAWADFDNDGDQDLIQLVDGGFQPNLLYENLDGASLVNIAAQAGVDFGAQRGKTPLWFDYDRDGFLDLAAASHTRATDPDILTRLYRNAAGGFEDVTAAVGVGMDQTVGFYALSDLWGNGTLELLPRTGAFPAHVYDVTGVPFIDVGPQLDSVGGPRDAVVADLTGDLMPDIYVVRGEPTSEILQVDATTLEAHLGVTNINELGIDVVTTGIVQLELHTVWQVRRTQTFVGESPTPVTPTNLTLDPADETMWGMLDHVPGGDEGIYIGYDPTQQTWRLRASAINFGLNIVMEADDPISSVSATGFDPSVPPQADVFLANGASGFVNQTVAAGIVEPSWGRSVVAADFDNDMDLDLYILATGQTRNRPNIVYENQGNGQFVAIPDGAGAGGTDQGRGDALAVADYDLDGYLDIVATNGKSKPPFDRDGPVQLFRNAGGDNHWIMLDLQGTSSNRDAVGASVKLTTNGVTQLREQNGGMHFRGQNHQRMHFGLGQNPVADLVEIRWPNGITQRLNAVAADQILTVIEDTDADGDAIADGSDNCSQHENPDQADTDGDGYGNRCDPDWNNDGVVNFADLQLLKAVFFSDDENFDMDGDGTVGFGDLQVLRAFFFGVPGPSGVVGPGSRARTASGGQTDAAG